MNLVYDKDYERLAEIDIMLNKQAQRRAKNKHDNLYLRLLEVCSLFKVYLKDLDTNYDWYTEDTDMLRFRVEFCRVHNIHPDDFEYLVYPHIRKIHSTLANLLYYDIAIGNLPDVLKGTE